MPTLARSGPRTSHSGRTHKAGLSSSAVAAAFAHLAGAEAEAEVVLGPGRAYQQQVSGASAFEFELELELGVVAAPQVAPGAVHEGKSETGWLAIVAGTGPGVVAGRAVTVGATVAEPVAVVDSGADLEAVSALVAWEAPPVEIVPRDSMMPSHCPATNMAVSMPSGVGVVDPVELVVMGAVLGIEAAFVAAQHKNHFAPD